MNSSDSNDTSKQHISLENALISTKGSDIKGIILDFDGVLSSFEVRIGHPLVSAALMVKPDIKEEAIQKASIKVLKMLTTLDSMPKKTSLFKFAFQLGKEIGMNSFQTLRFIATAVIVYFKQHHTIIPNAGVREMLEELRKENYKIILLTNTSKKVIDIASEKIPEIHDFELVLTRDDFKSIKPDASGFHRVLEIMGLHPDEVISVGDQASDIIAGKRAGIRTIALNSDNLRHFKPQLMEYNPEYIIKDLRQLPELLQSIRDQIIEDIKMTIDLTEKSINEFLIDGSIISNL
ncbi:MAG: HAD family hydrolase [Candidatus Heimdallarchaeota archaeon]